MSTEYTETDLWQWRRCVARLLRNRTVTHAVLPLGVSLLMHSALFAALLTATWGAPGGGTGGGYARAEVVIDLPTLPSAQPPPSQAEAHAAASDVHAAAPSEGVLPRLQGLSSPTTSALPVLRSGAGHGDHHIDAADLRSRDDSLIGGATFAGLGTREAASIVYVVDASGAMVTSLPFVLAELERSVRNLSSAQEFQVVLFRNRPGGSSGGNPLYDIFHPPGSRRGQLVAATPANKAALAQWLHDIRPTGRSNPVDGLRQGLAFNPDAVFLLSRSIRRSGGELSSEVPGGVWGRPPAETLAELERLNPRHRLTGKRRAVIKAIQFLEEDPSGTMQAIGEVHGDGPGSYNVLTLDELRRQQGR